LNITLKNTSEQWSNPMYMQVLSNVEQCGAMGGAIIISYPSFDHDLVVHQAMIAIDFGYLMHFER
jgi:hypothetical protein